MPDFSSKSLILLAGPTASGKSRLAMTLAKTFDAEIINADAMQIYKDLRILSARPSRQDEAEVPHHLYGFAPAEEAFSAGAWRRAALSAVEAIEGRGKTPLIVGGSGLYFRALTEGLARIPDVPRDLREALRKEMEEKGAAVLYQRLLALDPDLAARIPQSDSQRILRGLEVVEASGVPLSVWQKDTEKPSLSRRVIALALMPRREDIYARCDARVPHMIKAGALAELSALLARRLSPSLPIMKALGVSTLSLHLQGRISLEDATHRLAQETRRYARRQITWIRHQMTDWRVLETPSEIIQLLKGDNPA